MCIESASQAAVDLLTSPGARAERGGGDFRAFGGERDVIAREELRAGSDIDILVDFAAPVTLFEFARLRRRLESLLGRSVDLVTRAMR